MNLLRNLIFSGVMLGICLIGAPKGAIAETEAIEVLESLPVQSGGRIKPFQSFAKEAVLYITGRSSFKGEGASKLVWLWFADPKTWSGKSLIRVSYEPLHEVFGLMLDHGRVSPEVLTTHAPFLQYVEAAQRKKQDKEVLSTIESKSLGIYERAVFFKQLSAGLQPGFAAHPEDPRIGWLPLQSLRDAEGQKIAAQHFGEENVRALAEALTKLLDDIKDDQNVTLQKARTLQKTVAALFDSRQIAIDQQLLTKELRYNKLHPFGWAWKFYLLAALLLLAAIISKNPKMTGLGLFLCAVGFVFHSYGFYLRCMIAGRPPVSNMYESIVWVSWAVIFFSGILYSFYRSGAIPFAASVVATLTLILADSFPIMLDPSISPLVPVLRSNYWLTIHVLTITLSYGAFALAWGLGHAVVFSYAFAKDQSGAKDLAQFLYRAVQIGVILLAAGTVLGGVWAHYSWGRFWGWDPKETWALIALLGYLAVLHGRLVGWLKTFGFAFGVVAAFLLIVMAWYGVNFVLAAGLHSYGFGGGGAIYVLAVACFDLIIVSWAAFVYRNKKGINRI